MNDKEPEELLANAKYLLELIQQDLNLDRKETIPARVNAALNYIESLDNIYNGNAEPIKITSDEGHAFYKDRGYSPVCPDKVGLYSVVCGESNWETSYVAVTKNDYQMLIAHCSDLGERPVEQFHYNLEGTMWFRVA